MYNNSDLLIWKFKEELIYWFNLKSMSFALLLLFKEKKYLYFHYEFC